MPALIVRNAVGAGYQDYVQTWEAMRAFTDARDADTPDELWLLEHAPVYTLGQAGKPEHLLAPGNIPLVRSDRGGQVTYHGPGQIVGYLLFDLRRLGMGVRDLVSMIEQSIIDLLQDYGLAAVARRDAPGVYIDGAKVAALGLRVRKGCSYHGLSLNVAMDLAPFGGINPCGYQGLAVTQTRDLGIAAGLDEMAGKLTSRLMQGFGYDAAVPQALIQYPAA